ncbi:hypothetical protein DEU56DRAFT_761629 [Suillus clintonianus]|uniref:uncharacterized protein n=1 Tax=Suillus clintonianus TaxID=1904413 RepID=UPI001B875297|nr:uncharacterized protein DEU56DRAFT_761629 [Suillus clintonianus]KAG2115635.1 hypothetical protein DEU56DRAFT_761629 [Suillus clintonianus]
MSQLEATQHRTDESSSDERTGSTRSVIQGSISNPIQCQATSATEPRLCHSTHKVEGVKNAQLENQALKERLRAVEEQNTVLLANKGRRKKDISVSEDILAFEVELKVCAKRYGLTVNMFPPPAALLKTTLPNPALPFNTAARYTTKGSQEIAVLAELYNMLPQHLHHLVPMNHFFNVFSKAVCAGRASELKQLRSVTGQIFELPQHYFAISHTHDTEPEIQQLLGITGKAGKSYPLLPPLLFPGNIIDRSRKTLFGNWQPIAKTLACCLKGRTSLSNGSRQQGGAPPNAVKWGVMAVTPGAMAWALVANIFMLSPDQEFPQEGKGKTSRINYSTVFAFFKELLVCDWEKPHLKEITKHINTFVFEHASRPSHDLNSRDSTDDLQEEMHFAQLGLAADAEEDPSDPDLDTSIDVLAKAAGMITIVSALTTASHSSSVSSSQPVFHKPVAETEVIVIEETDIQKMKSKAGRPKKSKVVWEGDNGPGESVPQRRGRSKK